jgi:serine/threonine protein kinase
MEKARPNLAGTGKAESAQIPSHLGDYQIVREIGRGGMGIVYEAIQESLHRHVALKVLPFHSWVQPKHLERFAREAQAAARLHHTNIVPVSASAKAKGFTFTPCSIFTAKVWTSYSKR